MKLIIKLAITVGSLLVVDYLVPGLRFDTVIAAVVTAIVLGIVNTLIRPILQIIALPISLLTFGIFAFLINVSLFYLVSFIVPGFEIESFYNAAISSILMTLVSWFLNKLAKE